MTVELEKIATPYRLTSSLVKRREGESEPYEVIEHSWWHEPDGTEITDPDRIAQLEAEQAAKENR